MDVKETQEGTMKKVEQFQMNDGSTEMINHQQQGIQV